MSTRISYLNPPLFETAFSIQFQAIEKLTNAYLGKFWSEHLIAEFPNSSDAALIEDASEVVERGERRLRLPRIRIGTGPDSRLMLRSKSGDQMVQLQRSRIVVNWIKTADGGRYCRFEPCRDRLLTLLHTLNGFVNANELGELNPNLWEVVYVNRIPKENAWTTVSDLPSLLPGFFGRLHAADLPPISANGKCVYELVGVGRLYVEIDHGFEGASVDDPEIVTLQITARGPINETSVENIARLLNEGHTAVVESFDRIIGEEAKKLWKRQ